MDRDGVQETSSRKSWGSFVESLIEQVEFVSSHFGYSEEYILSHSPAWVNRKSGQARREQFEKHSERVLEGFKSLALLVDSALNGGKAWDKLLPSSLEEAMKLQHRNEPIKSHFVTGLWWKPKTES